MFVVWFKKDGVWHWIEIFMFETANIVRSALKEQGYEVSETSEHPEKYSIVNTYKGK